jgi:large subunit ribosomal protein L28
MESLFTRLVRSLSAGGTVSRRDAEVWDGRPFIYSPLMPRICHVCAKGPAFGHNRSHSMVATKRRFDPNLQRVRIDDGGTPRRVYVCTRCLKAGKIVKAR